MVIDLGMATDRTEAGYYAGALAASFFIGRGIGSPFWGIFIDRFGRKKGLVIALSSGVVSLSATGFVPNYVFLVILRFFSGVMSPIAVIGKVLVSELCPND